MRKKHELSDPNSCFNKAKDDERIFVLLGRDEAAPAAIQAWIDERIRLGKNLPEDPQIAEAKECARVIAVEIQLKRDLRALRDCMKKHSMNIDLAMRRNAHGALLSEHGIGFSKLMADINASVSIMNVIDDYLTCGRQ